MSRTVFILGAGASALAGAPLMNEFVGAARDVMRGTQELFPKEREYFDLVFKARGLLQQVHSKSELNINNVESLFGTFEMAALLGRLGTLSSQEVERLPNAVSYVIAKTIETKIRYPVDAANGQVAPPRPYGDFVELVQDLQRRERGSASIITFNYDVALDYALHFDSVPFDYRYADTAARELPGSSAIDLLKLHGSLNWGGCRQCAAVCPWRLKDVFSRLQWPQLGKREFVTLELSNHLVQLSCPSCGSPLAENPVIVPPTWNKGKFHTRLSSVWRTAAAHLAEAENVFVIGYSLPDTDEFFRYFYALGSVGDSVLSTFCVVDIDGSVFNKFKRILGPTARDCFVSMASDFNGSITKLRKHLGLPMRS